jgi:hypothetical protein
MSLSLRELEVRPDAKRPRGVDDRSRRPEEPRREIVNPVGERVVKDQGLEGSDRHPLCVNGIEAGEAGADDQEPLREPIEVLAEKRGERRREPAVKGGIRQTELATDELEMALAECLYRAIHTNSESEGERRE